MLKKRSSGILLHISSLPSRFGIGDLGPEAIRFADFMHQAGLSYWQILPLNPVEGQSGYSPYSGLSAFAGNPLLISPDLLADEGYVQESDLQLEHGFREDRVDFEHVVPFKKQLLEKAFISFRNDPTQRQAELFEKFCNEHGEWLDNFAEYMALKNHFERQAWFQWPVALRDRNPDILSEYREKLREEILREKFLQFVFFQQWETLKMYCKDRGIHFFGDVPFYVGYDSADVWANAEIFKLDKDKSPVAVAGVPPDYFSETGQLWGMPVFDWKKLRKSKYDWWIRRITHNLLMFDIIRLDHFRAFSDYWEVPAGEATAINGSWQEGPRSKFFQKLKKKFPELPIIAEDLGDIDQPVYDLMNEFGLPGMKVLLFAFGEGMPKNSYINHHHTENSVVYTGTHDNNTVRGWYEQARDTERQNLQNYLSRSLGPDEVAPALVRMAMSSVSRLCVIPMQDYLGMGREGVMNIPSTASGNWGWRMTPYAVTDELIHRIRSLNELYDRCSEAAKLA
ncbi:MAG: 4-alpha-glucanotransferase [Cyclobacteriaceae bacterium]